VDRVSAVHGRVSPLLVQQPDVDRQRPHATRVAGYGKWQQLGRQVRKGERAIKILGYSTKKITKTDPDTGDEVEDRLVRYPILSVFDPLSRDRATPRRRLAVPSGPRHCHLCLSSHRRISKRLCGASRGGACGR
jgi:hypothetical protein